MSLIKISQKGDFSLTLRFLRKLKERRFLKKMDSFGQIGVDALQAATPKRSGKTADSWGYEVHYGPTQIVITWTNSNVNKGRNIAVLIQYGHGTRNGGYVRGIDYINPAMRPIFEKIADDAWLEVISDE